MTLRHLGLGDCQRLAASFKKSYHEGYLAMYTSVLGGVVTHPFLMTIPMDDHLVHRGDGVFEVFKCADGKIYNLRSHLERLERSARAIYLKPPADIERITSMVIETVRVAGARDCLIRLFLSRGPGGFSTNPYECPTSQIYIVVSRLILPPAEHYTRGVTAKSSTIPVKKSYFANIKSCNYLPNVLMKKEAVDAGVNYTISIDENGFVGEGATENVGVVTRDQKLKLPTFARILQGTTVTRVTEMAEELVGLGKLRGLTLEDITLSEAYSSAEILLFGTSFGILPVTVFDGHSIGTGSPGPVFRLLQERLDMDIRNNTGLQTVVFADEE